MRIRVEKALVLDLEATCWKTKEEQGEQTQDIIEVGIAVVDLVNRKIKYESGYSQLVRPVNSVVNDYCTDITGITPEMVKNKGIPFNEMCNQVTNKYGENTIWMSYGYFDYKLFNEQCNRMAVKLPFGKNYYNLKNMNSIFGGYKKEFGLDNALAERGMKFEGMKHRAYDDAENAARVLLHMLRS